MAKKKKSDFKYIRAIVDADGELHFSWQLAKPGAPPGGHAHDECVDGWSDDDIIALAQQMACVDDDDPVEIEVIR